MVVLLSFQQGSNHNSDISSPTGILFQHRPASMLLAVERAIIVVHREPVYLLPDHWFTFANKVSGKVG